MSIKAIDWAWKQKLSPTQKYVLNAIANFADDDGIAWPSNARIVEMTGLSERSVKGAKAYLKTIGLIEQIPGFSRQKIRLCLDKMTSQSASAASQSAAPALSKGARPAPQSASAASQSAAPAPINKNRQLTTNNHQKKEPSQNPSSDLFTDPIAEQPPCQTKATPSKPKLERIPEQDFDEFWAAYPRKEGKGSARKAFEKARRKISQRLLIRCVLAWPFAEKLSDRGDFRPHPATWLNNERWLDESVRHVLKVTDETPEQREAIAAFNRARDAYIAKISMGVTQSGMKMPVLEDFLAKHAQLTRRDNIAVH